MREALLQLLRDGLPLAVAPLLTTVILIMALRPIATRLGLVDHPSGRKQHAALTPLVGGQAIVLGALPAAVALLPMTPDIVALGAASLLLLVVGTLDDRFDVNWRIRLGFQAAAGMILYFWGGVRIESIGAALGFEDHSLGILSLPFTVLATVGVTNAINMADGVDGLAGTLCLAAFGMLIAAAIYAGNKPLALDLVVMAACVLGFLLFNLRTPWNRQAKVFLGGGSEILGLWIAWASFRLTQTPGHPVTPVLAPFLIAPPVIDCLVLIVRRLRAGRSPFSADRDHLHHRLLDLGFSTSGIVIALTCVSLAIGFTAALARRGHIPEPIFPMMYLAVLGVYFHVSARHARRPTNPAKHSSSSWWRALRRKPACAYETSVTFLNVSATKVEAVDD